jgi:hypothetical protein
MFSPTGTNRPAVMAASGGYAPINPKKAKSRVPGRGTSYQGNNLPFQSLSSQGNGKPGLDTGTSFPKVVSDAKGPA